MIVSWTSLALDQAIRERHSTRMFLPQPVPRALVDEVLALAGARIYLDGWPARPFHLAVGLCVLLGSTPRQ